MYDLLAKLFLIAALAQIGMSLSDLRKCHSRQCLGKIENASRDILKIDWKPISLFPNEAKKFQ